jgi:hypothetical protein
MIGGVSLQEETAKRMEEGEVEAAIEASLVLPQLPWTRRGLAHRVRVGLHPSEECVEFGPEVERRAEDEK